MGKLIDGKWVPSSVITSDDSGAYDRVPRSFLDSINKDHPKFKPEKNRYHLFVSYACPWAHRTLIFRKLKQLEEIVKTKEGDLTGANLDNSVKIIAGTARSMGIEVEE